MKERLLAGEPIVIFEADTIRESAEDTGVREFIGIATDLSSAFSRWLLLEAASGEPFNPDLVEAATAFEDYCAAHGVSTGDALPSSAAPIDETLESQGALALTIRGRLEQLIDERDVPYVISRASFEEPGPAALEAGFPEGTAWWVIFEDPIPVLDEVTLKTVLYEPLDIYAESLRPTFEAGRLGFVVDYFLAWDNPTKDIFEIPPFALNLYLRGEIDIEEFSNKIVITGNK